MQSRIQKWGNSLGLRIPVHLAKQLNLHPGSSVELTINEERDQLIIQAPHYDLKTLVEAITQENQHNLLLEDETQLGSEEW